MTPNPRIKPLILIATLIACVFPISAVTLRPASPNKDPNKVIIFVDITGYEQKRGPIYGALYNNEDDFLNDSKAIHKFTLRPETQKITINLPPLNKGDYAITLYHDTNNNGKMDQNFIGIPKEPYAISNDAKGFFGPPKFKNAAISFHSSGQRIPLIFN